MTQLDRTLDWVPRFDERSRGYGIRAAVGEVRLHNRSWRTPGPLDQGREGACVGFGWTHEALTTPVRVVLGQDGDSFARNVYHQAQEIDEWAGVNYEGTSVLAGAKVLKQLGYLVEYRWGFNARDVVTGILTSGPVVLGINWHEGMYEAPGGIVQVEGPIVGGHCILAVGYRLPGVVFEDEAAVGLFNSWGPDWGHGGHAWIRQSELSALMEAGGEACIPFRRSYGPRPVAGHGD